MKRPTTLFAATFLLLTATGCHHITIPTAAGPATVWSFGQHVTIGSLQWSTNGTMKLQGYNNDQVQGLQAVVQGAVSGAVEGLKP